MFKTSSKPQKLFFGDCSYEANSVLNTGLQLRSRLPEAEAQLALVGATKTAWLKSDS